MPNSEHRTLEVRTDLIKEELDLQLRGNLIVNEYLKLLDIDNDNVQACLVTKFSSWLEKDEIRQTSHNGLFSFRIEASRNSSTGYHGYEKCWISNAMRLGLKLQFCEPKYEVHNTSKNKRVTALLIN